MQLGRLSIFKSHEPAFASYGFAVSEFSSVEFGMLFVFLKLKPGPEESTIEFYWSIKSSRGRFEWIKSQLNSMPETDANIERWRGIAPRIDKAIIVRNDLAHGEFAPIYTSPHRAIVGFWAHLAKSASKGDLSYNNQTTMIDGTKFYSVDDLETIGLEYIDLGESLAAFARQWEQSRS